MGPRLTCIALATTSALLLALTFAPAWAAPLLWGVDEDDGQLFTIGNYMTPSTTFTNYGLLRFGGSPIGNNIEAFTIDLDHHTAYMARNRSLGGVTGPVLLRFDLLTASTVSPNVVTIVGRIGRTSNDITGLAFHPTTGALYALRKVGGTDHLLIINKATGGVMTDVGAMKGLGHKVGDGEELAFDESGNLYVTDNADDHLYQIDPATGAIIAVVDSNEKRGLGARRVKFEGLAWDFENDKLIGTEDDHNLFAHLPFDNGNTIPFGRVPGLTDVEGIAFDPPVASPEPGTLLLLGSGLAGLGGAAWRRNRRK